MKGHYQRLVELASETDAPSTPEKIWELNVLLSELSFESTNKEHVLQLDDLISISSNTSNLHIEYRESNIALQDVIRSQ